MRFSFTQGIEADIPPALYEPMPVKASTFSVVERVFPLPEDCDKKRWGMITLNFIGQRCGYMGLEEGHPLYGSHWATNTILTRAEFSPVLCMSGLMKSAVACFNFGSKLWFIGFNDIVDRGRKSDQISFPDISTTGYFKRLFTSRTSLTFSSQTMKYDVVLEGLFLLAQELSAERLMERKLLNDEVYYMPHED